MDKTQKFDPVKVADIARRLEELQDRLVHLRNEEETARQTRSSAECDLANLRTEFTRLVASQLDHTNIPMDPRIAR